MCSPRCWLPCEDFPLPIAVSCHHDPCPPAVTTQVTCWTNHQVKPRFSHTNVSVASPARGEQVDGLRPTSRLYSIDKSVSLQRCCQRRRDRFFLGLCSPSRYILHFDSPQAGLSSGQMKVAFRRRNDKEPRYPFAGCAQKKAAQSAASPCTAADTKCPQPPRTLPCRNRAECLHPTPEGVGAGKCVPQSLFEVSVASLPDSMVSR